MGKTLDQTYAESGRQSELDALRATPGAYEKAVAEFNAGGGTGGGDLGGYLDNFQNNLYGASTDLRVPTAEEIKAQVTPSSPVPTPINRNEIFQQQREAMGVTALEDELNTIKTAIANEEATTRIRTKAEEGKPVATNVIAGRVSETERQQAERLDVLTRQANRVVDELNTKYSVISQFVQYAGLDYQDAVAAYDSEFQRNLSIYGLVADARKEVKDDIKFAQSVAAANLQTFMSAVTSGNLSYGDLSGDQKVMVSKLEAQAGLPVGFVSKLKMNPNDKLVTVNQDTGEALIFDENGNMKVINTGLTPSPKSGGVSGLSATQTRNYQSTALKLATDIDKKYVTQAGEAVARRENKYDQTDYSDGLLSDAEANLLAQKLVNEVGDVEIAREVFNNVVVFDENSGYYTYR